MSAELEEIVAGLNEEQRQAVLAGDGPLLVIAGAGSGKTRVLTVRIAHLILDRGVDPEKILAITFTRKAATEMKERLEGLLGEDGKKIWAATFHSALIKLLRPYSGEMGLRPGWTIIDQDDARAIIKNCTEDLHYDPKEVSPGGTMGVISNWKNHMVSPKQAWDKAEDEYEVIRARIYKAYQEALAEANAVDFDDILFKSVHLLREHPEILAHFQRRFDYLFVDEYQDTNVVQHELVQMLGAVHQNVCVVGDSDQCFPPETLITTPDGPKRADEIEVGDVVLGTGGSSALQPATVAHVKEGRWSGRMHTVSAGGRVLRGTPHHILLADVNTLDEDKWLVCLARRFSGGFDVITTTAALLGQVETDKLWILQVCDSPAAAEHYRSFYSVHYALSRRSRAGEDLMEDLDLHREFPHLRAEDDEGCQPVRLTMFSGTRTLGEATGHSVAGRGIDVHGAPLRGRSGFDELEVEVQGYSAALEVAHAVASATGAEIDRRAQIDGDVYAFTPLAHLREGMTILVREGDDLVRVQVDRVSVDDYDGAVYDFEVEGIHTYVANDCLVHNSIYGFRGSKMENFLQFDKTFPDTTTITLERNYRSTATILNAANAVIANNTERPEKKLWTETEGGAEIVVQALHDNDEENRWIAQQVVRQLNRGRKGSDIAVLCRMKALAEDVEKALIAREVPCRLVGGLGFLQRAVIKDALCYLRMVVNPDDQPAFRRVVNTPRRQVGDASVKKLRSWAKLNGLTLREALTKVDLMELPPAAERGLTTFLNVMDAARELDEQEASTAGAVLELILARFSYYDHVAGLGGDVAPGKLADLATLVAIAKNYHSAQEFLEEIALMLDTGDDGEDSNRVLIMTMHASKGLEFDVVFSPGWEDGVFPSLREHTKEEQEEERRLAYVVITRARQQLFLTRARTRVLWGKASHNPPSPFLLELPPELLSFPD